MRNSQPSLYRRGCNQCQGLLEIVPHSVYGLGIVVPVKNSFSGGYVMHRNSGITLIASLLFTIVRLNRS